MSTQTHSFHQHLQETRKLLTEHQNGNIYTVKELSRSNRLSQMMIPVHQYVGRPIIVHEDVPMGEQCDDPLPKSPVRLLFFDPKELKPSPEYPIATRIGFVQFAYHLATHGEKQTSVHPVSVWIRDRVKLEHEGFDSIREHRVLQAIRPQGFESNQARRPDYHSSILTQPVQHPRDYFPQWNFLRDGHNDYVVTEFAADGNLVRFVHSRIDMYRVNYLHERLVSMDLSFLGNECQLRSAVAFLWQQEALCICAKIADAVAYMHSRGVGHLNLSPESVLVTETLNPMIVDFDQAELADTDGVVGRNRSILSKIAWQAPEIAKHNRNGDKSAGTKGKAADVYALGVLMYYLLAIYPPHVTDRSKPVMDPVTQDRSWISNLRAHVSGETLSHEPADCHICNGKLHFDDRVMFVLHNALHPNSQSRLSAAQISQALADFQTDFEPDLFCRLCQLSASKVVKNDEALAHG